MANPDSALSTAEKPKMKRVPMTPAKAIEAAGKMFSSGQVQHAHDVAKQIVQHNPKLADGYNILGVSLNAMGNRKEAVAMLQKAIALAPRNASFHANLGEIERQNGRVIEARQALQKAIELDPKQASAYNNLGILHFQRGAYKEAIAAYSKAVKLNPNFAEAYNNLANASRFVNQHSQALRYYHKALQHREQYPEAYNNLGTLLRDAGKPAEAEHAYRKAMLQNPNYIEAFNNLATLQFQQGKDTDALRTLSDALRVQAENPETLTITAKVQLRRNNFPACEQAARRALKVKPDHADAMVVLGQLFHETDRYDEAVTMLEDALKIAPNSPEAHNFYGVTLKSVGRLEEGRAEILKALELNSQNYGAYANLNDLVDFKDAPELVEKMEAIFAASDNHDDPRFMALHFGFAKALEDIGQHPRALDHYLKGAKAKRALLNYNEQETLQFFADIKATFPAEVFANRRFPGLPTDRPIFIVGMPRSGSTLVEQILSSHPEVYGAGEVKYLARAIGQMRDRFPSMAKYPAVFREMDKFHFEMIGKSYLKQIEPTAGTHKRITDKLLTNYFFVGLIHMIFPHAKFIHTRRNPVDTCLSAFTKLFKDDMPHSYDFGELGRYYLEYQSLMDHWHKVLPAGTLIDVQYEEVVGDVEGNARKLIEFVGLPWDPACVDFHKSSRPVKTASVAQVRKPVYTGSVERWRKYGPGIQPLVDALGYKPATPVAAKPAEAKPAAGSRKKSSKPAAAK